MLKLDEITAVPAKAKEMMTVTTTKVTETIKSSEIYPSIDAARNTSKKFLDKLSEKPCVLKAAALVSGIGLLYVLTKK